MKKYDAEIKQLKEISDIKECVNVTKSAWEGIPDIETIPDHVFKAFAENGILLGAEQEGQIVGYAAVMEDMHEDDSYYLHAIGVDPDQAGKNVGKDLMCFLRDEVLERNSDGSISWTYDPLLGANANLYIEKLGGMVQEYERDMYGNQENSVTAGETPTDRFLVNWDLGSERVETKLENHYSSPFKDIESLLEVDSSLEPLENYCSLEEKIGDNNSAEAFGVEIPYDLDLIKKEGKEKEWREATRNVFEPLLNDKNYQVVDFNSDIVNRKKRATNLYILS